MSDQGDSFWHLNAREWSPPCEADESMNEYDIVEDGTRLKFNVRVPFPTEHYATSAINALGVDAPF